MAEEVGPHHDGAQVVDIPMEPKHVSSIEASIIGNDVGLILSSFRNAYAMTGGERTTLARTEPVAMLVMSPGTAKDLMYVMMGLVEQLERDHGPISTSYTKSRETSQA